MGPMHESVCLTPLAAVVSLDALLAEPVSFGSASFQVADDISCLDEILDAHSARRAVQRFVEGLTSRQRDLVFRIFWEDEPQASVARSQGISGAAVSKSLKKILELGRCQLARYQDTHLNGVQSS